MNYSALVLFIPFTLSAMTYQDAGVSINTGNKLVAEITSLVQSTKRSGCDAKIGGFGSLFDMTVLNYQQPVLVSGTDGVGTKLQLTHVIQKYDTIGIDLVAMCVNDILAQGAEPLFFLDYFATSHLDLEQTKQVITGIVDGCKQSGCALIGGETAEMPGTYKTGEYDLAGFTVGIVEKDLLLPKKDTINAGDVIIGLASSGLHSNGFSLVRTIIKKNKIELLDPPPFESEHARLIDALLVPTTIYAKCLVPLFKTGVIKGVAHITGGGLVENIPRALPNNLSTDLDYTTWKTPPVFEWLAHYVEQKEMARVFNMGIGMVLISSSKHTQQILKHCANNNQQAFCIGNVIKKSEVTLGTPLTATAKKVLLCGSGELGKELAIELQQLGVEVIACDKYPNAPAMQVAHQCHVFDMTDGKQLRTIIEQEQPDLIVPEIESIATDTLLELEQEGFTVIPTARATYLTMNRKQIRTLAATTLGLKTSAYAFANTKEEFLKVITTIGLPCVVKPVMSSSGKGQTVIRTEATIEDAWNFAASESRGIFDGIIVEEFINFDSEMTLLTIRHKDGTSFCDPIGHTQVDGDYRQSWQPHSLTKTALQQAQTMAKKITDDLGGLGLFGVEFFLKGDEVYFSELSPRPHDTGMVTLISQNLSEFALHARAILGLPIPEIVQRAPSASQALLVKGDSTHVQFGNLEAALSTPGTTLRLFGKPEVHGTRRMGVALAESTTVAAACKKAEEVVNAITIEL